MINKILSLSFLFVFTISFAQAQQRIDATFFNDANAFFQKQVKNGKLAYAGLKNDAVLKALIQRVETTNINGADDKTLQAFYINAYNLHVINQAAQRYPIQSVQSIGGFFDRKKITVAGESLTLNQLEKEKLLKAYKDPRYHFVLVCGALGCPPITDFAYQPSKLEQQLEQQTRSALNDPSFIKVKSGENKVEISKIFQWYPGDFGGSPKKAVDFINKYRNNPIPKTYKVGFYEYDWNLNDRSAGTTGRSGFGEGPANASRYVVSSTIPKGTVELKIFNNLYTQRNRSEAGAPLTTRSTFLTTAISALYGLNERLNVGLELRYRHVRNDNLPSAASEVLIPRSNSNNRFGLTGIGPKVRWAPVKEWSNFSIQSAFLFTPGEDLTGNSEKPFIDWDGAIWFTQFFNDFSIGNRFSVFTEIDFWIEDFGTQDEFANQISTPVTVILSFFPNPQTTLYVLSNYSKVYTGFDGYFAQGGVGAKYQFTPNIELELLYTRFTSNFLQDESFGGRAATYNLGMRFNF